MDGPVEFLFAPSNKQQKRDQRKAEKRAEREAKKNQDVPDETTDGPENGPGEEGDEPVEEIDRNDVLVDQDGRAHIEPVTSAIIASGKNQRSELKLWTNRMGDTRMTNFQMANLASVAEVLNQYNQMAAPHLRPQVRVVTDIVVECVRTANSSMQATADYIRDETQMRLFADAATIRADIVTALTGNADLYKENDALKKRVGTLEETVDTLKEANRKQAEALQNLEARMEPLETKSNQDDNRMEATRKNLAEEVWRAVKDQEKYREETPVAKTSSGSADLMQEYRKESKESADQLYEICEQMTNRIVAGDATISEQKETIDQLKQRLWGLSFMIGHLYTKTGTQPPTSVPPPPSDQADGTE